MCEGPSLWLEKTFYPECLTPNVITLMGNLPQIAMIFVVFSQIGMKMTSDEPTHGLTLMLAAAALQWFSQHDIMDGLRARRLKTGSPLGRIIDEALDMIQQACYCLWVGYIFRFDNLLCETILTMPNVVFWTSPPLTDTWRVYLLSRVLAIALVSINNSCTEEGTVARENKQELCSRPTVREPRFGSVRSIRTGGNKKASARKQREMLTITWLITNRSGFRRARYFTTTHTCK